MFKKIVLLVLILAIMFIACSCWDSLDVNDKELSTTVVVGKENDDDIFWVELANFSNGAKDSSSDKFTVVKSSGGSYAEARQDLDNKLPKPVFLGTIRVVGLTESVAKDGISEYCFRMRNLLEYRKALLMITVPDDPTELFETQICGSGSTGHTIEAIVHKLDKTGNAIDSSLSNVLEWLSSDHSCFLLPHFDVESETLNLNGYSVIDDDALISFIPISESTGIHYILNDFVKHTYSVPFNKYNATVEVQLKDRKIEPNYSNNKVSFDIGFTFFSLVKYLDINDGLTPAYQNEVKENLIEQIAKDIQLALATSQKDLHCDYLNLSEHFRIKYPNVFEKMSWDEAYMNSTINFRINMDLVPGREYDYDPDVKWKGNDDE